VLFAAIVADHAFYTGRRRCESDELGVCRQLLLLLLLLMLLAMLTLFSFCLLSSTSPGIECISEG
jgi:hypothetical protein